MPDQSLIQLSEANLERMVKNPFLVVPPEVRQPAMSAWLAYRSLSGLESPSAITFPAAVWMNSHGVPAAVVAEALKAATHPAVSARVRFASDLMAVVAEQVHKLNQKRLADHLS